MTHEETEQALKLGELLRQTRRGAGLSMAEVARRMEVSRNTVKSWEDECTAIPLPRFLRFCRVTGADPVPIVTCLYSEGCEPVVPHA